MKQLMIAFIIIFPLQSFCQNLQFQPLENNPNYDEILSAVHPQYDYHAKNLYYFNYRYSYILNYLNSPTELIDNDSILFEVTKLNVATGNKKKYAYKKFNDSSSISFSRFNTYIDTTNSNLYFITSINKDSDYNTTTINIYENRKVNILDTNMVLKSSVRLFNNFPSVMSGNYLVENDSNLLCINFDNPNQKNGLFRYNYLNGNIVDSFYYQNSSKPLGLVYDLNDSTYILMSDSFAIYLDKQLNYKSKTYINASGPFFPNSVPNYNLFHKFNKSDSSLYYVTLQTYPFTLNERSQFESLRFSEGGFKVYTKVNHDTVYNINTANSKSIEHSIKNTDFINLENKYCVTNVGQADNVVSATAIMNFDANNQLRWKKYIGFDAFYRNAMVLATPDSGCMVLVNRKDVINLQEKYDLYYIKLDKNGNQETNYLPVSVSTFPEVSKTDVVVYPNPFNETLTFKSAKQTNYQLIVYDVSGKKIVSKNIDTNQPIYINNLPTGTYFYTLSEKNKLAKGGVIEKK